MLFPDRIESTNQIDNSTDIFLETLEYKRQPSSNMKLILFVISQEGLE